MRHLSKVLFGGDKSPANGSSIAVLASYNGKSCLLAGDAHSSTLAAGIRRLVPPGERLELDAFKLSHHGSQANINEELLDAVRCSRYLVSTNGAIFQHPDPPLFTELLQRSPTPVSLYFNYDVPTTRAWAGSTDARLKKEKLKELHYPAPGTDGLLVELAPSPAATVPASRASPRRGKARAPRR
jgi:hypothetical protein